MTKTKDIIIKILVEVARILLGVTFLFSGFVKAVDPFGTAYKIEDYFTSFGLSSLSSLALPLSALLCTAEFLMGAFMLLGIYRKWNSRLVLLTMCFMTPLTLYLAIASPVADCGCFGDAWIISNWETFFKNLILLPSAILVAIYHYRIKNLFTGKTYWLAFLYLILVTGLFVFRNYLYEPVFDFRPYKVGANIPKLMNVEEGKGRVEETILVYSKDGVEKEFTDQNSPWDDASWEFVRMETKLISEGESAIIKDLHISQLKLDKNKTEVLNMEDITEDVLSDSNYVFLMISPLLTEMSNSYLSNFEDVEDYAREYRYKFYCLTASGPEDIIAWGEENSIDFDFANVDERELKTIMRSNPGLLLLKNGVVINKWADISVPTEEDLNISLDQLTYGQQIDRRAKDKKNLLYITALFILPLLGLKLFDLLFFWRKPRVETRKKEQTEEDPEEELMNQN